MTPDSTPGQETPGILNRGLIVLIVGIIVVLIAFLAFGMMQEGQGSGISPADCGVKAIAYINSNLATPGTSAQLVSAAEKQGVYELKTKYQAQDITLYATKDCALLFTNTVNMSASSGSSQQAAAAATPAPVKSARPAADMYVMAFCPYGTQAEMVMSPVVKLLGSKADIRIRYITAVTGTTADSVSSLHGAGEAQEDLNQVCINKYYPDKFWAYLDAFDANCYPSWQNSAALDTCRKNTTASLAIDDARIAACAQGPEGIALLKTDEADGARVSATASPMLFVNGVEYSGARTPEAFKEFICSSFDAAPSECSTALSSNSTSASGGCG